MIKGLSSFEAVFIALLFIVPGYILSASRNFLVITEEGGSGEQLVRYFTYSALSNAICLVVFSWLGNTDWANPVSLLILIFLGPIFLGFISGWITRNDYVHRLFRRIGVQTSSSVPSAWDSKFGELTEQWVIVTLKSGITFYGFYGTKSFASSGPKKDLLIQDVYEVDKDGKWELQGSKCLLIAPDEVRTIEFFPFRDLEKSDG